jgi:hypothetical protein
MEAWVKLLAARHGLGPGPRPIQLTTAKVAMKMAVETGKPIDREGVRADKAVPAKLKQQRRRGGM